MNEIVQGFVRLRYSTVEQVLDTLFQKKEGQITVQAFQLMLRDEFDVRITEKNFQIFAKSYDALSKDKVTR